MFIVPELAANLAPSVYFHSLSAPIIQVTELREENGRDEVAAQLRSSAVNLTLTVSVRLTALMKFNLPFGMFGLQRRDSS